MLPVNEMSQLRLEQLHALEGRWRSANAPILGHLRPGLSVDAIRAKVARYPDLHLPEELELWWSWHNGASNGTIGGTRLALSLEQALHHYEDASQPDGDHWLKIASEQDEIYIDCSGASSTVGKIYSVPFAEPARVALPSVGALVDTWIDLIDRGAWTWSDSSLQWVGTDRDLVPPHAEQFMLW